MEPIVVPVKDECCELRLEINKEEQWIVVSRLLLTKIFDAAMIVIVIVSPVCIGGNSPTHSIFSNI